MMRGGRPASSVRGVNVQGVRRRLLSIDPAVLDGALVLVLLVAGVAQTWPAVFPSIDRWDRVDWIRYATPLAVSVVSAVALWFRRTYPVGTVATLVIVGVITEVQPVDLATPFIALVVALYSLGRYGRSRGRSLGAALVAVAAAGAVNAIVGDGIDAWFLFMGALLLGVWAAGDTARASEARAEALEVRSARLEAERHEDAARAAADERARIARELHDVIAHNVSVMVVQAAAARRIVDRDPDQARESLATIESTGRQALAEMRRLLGVIRRDDEPPAAAPQPTLARLPSLIDEMRASGLPVDLSVDGAVRALPPGIDVNAYRIVQEALTNALRHVGRTSTRVAVRYRNDAVEVEVVDDGPADGHDAADRVSSAQPSTGHGLVGMRERVTLVRGELEAGPRPEGGFRVWARLPFEGSST
jgi:signal transduction histidine kinase